MNENGDEPGFTPQDARATARAALGASLARLRHQKQLTGQQLGRLAGMSQAKISKIENGLVAASVHDIERLARALGAPSEVVEEYVDQASGLHDQFTDWRLTTQRLTTRQQDFARDEERATHIRVFQTALMPGLLQTTEYARAVLGEFATVLSGNRPGHDDDAPPTAVTIRIQRQEALYDLGKRFEFVLAEGVLGGIVGTPGEMLGQLDRLRTVAGQENVQVSILPSDARLDFPPLHGFHLFDDRAIAIDLVSTTVVSRGSEDVRMCRAVFDHFQSRATTEIGPIVDRYALHYLELARADFEHDTVTG